MNREQVREAVVKLYHQAAGRAHLPAPQKKHTDILIDNTTDSIMALDKTPTVTPMSKCNKCGEEFDTASDALNEGRLHIHKHTCQGNAAPKEPSGPTVSRTALRQKYNRRMADSSVDWEHTLGTICDYLIAQGVNVEDE